MRKPVDRRAVLERDGWRCRRCGVHCAEAGGLEVHHIVAVVIEDDPALENLAALCRVCHKAAPMLELGKANEFAAWCEVVPAHILEVMGRHVAPEHVPAAAAALVSIYKAMATGDESRVQTALAAARAAPVPWSAYFPV